MASSPGPTASALRIDRAVSSSRSSQSPLLPSPRTSRVRENGLLSLTLSSRGGEGDSLRLLGACYKQVTPNEVCCVRGFKVRDFLISAKSLPVWGEGTRFAPQLSSPRSQN